VRRLPCTPTDMAAIPSRKNSTAAIIHDVSSCPQFQSALSLDIELLTGRRLSIMRAKELARTSLRGEGDIPRANRSTERMQRCSLERSETRDKGTVVVKSWVLEPCAFAG
jgi:hypothetical protein